MKLAHAKHSLDIRAKLLASALKANKPAPGRYADGRNLYLLVSSTGAKSWVFMWTDKTMGKQRECGLGSYTGAGATVSLTLGAARIKADEVRAQIAAGVDPIAAKIAAQVAHETFADMLETTIKLNKGNPERGGWKVDANGVCGQAEDWRQKIKLHASTLSAMPVLRVGLSDVLKVLAPIWEKTPTTADRVRYIIEQVITKATKQGKFKGENPATLESVEAHLGSKVSTVGQKKQPSLAYAKLPAVIAQLLADARMAAKASVFCTLTATRTDEARLMKRSEIDWAAKLWIVPAARMKVLTENDRGGDHVVPLSDAAIALLRSVPETVGNDYVFAGQKAGQAVGETALNDMLTKTRTRGGLLALAGEATQHGMRATFRTWAKDAKFDADAAELCLAHVIGTKTTRSYDRAEMLEERTAIMQAWGNYATGVSNVVPLKVAA